MLQSTSNHKLPVFIILIFIQKVIYQKSFTIYRASLIVAENLKEYISDFVSWVLSACWWLSGDRAKQMHWWPIWVSHLQRVSHLQDQLLKCANHFAGNHQLLHKHQMPSYQYGIGNRIVTVVRLSYVYNGISYTGKMPSLFWICFQGPLHQSPE